MKTETFQAEAIEIPKGTTANYEWLKAACVVCIGIPFGIALLVYGAIAHFTLRLFFGDVGGTWLNGYGHRDF